MQFSPVRLTVDAIITRSDGTEEHISAINLSKKVNVDENDISTDNPSQEQA